jgi:hypothetical protein
MSALPGWNALFLAGACSVSFVWLLPLKYYSSPILPSGFICADESPVCIMSIATFIPTTAALCSVLLAFRYGWFFVPEHFGAMLGCKLLALYFVLIGREGQHVPAEVAVHGFGVVVDGRSWSAMALCCSSRELRRSTISRSQGSSGAGFLWSFSRHLRIDRHALC